MKCRRLIGGNFGGLSKFTCTQKKFGGTEGGYTHCGGIFGRCADRRESLGGRKRALIDFGDPFLGGGGEGERWIGVWSKRE